jgi:MoaA/NifB/PqqE/SkfB family radical SAM enzyme
MFDGAFEPTASPRFNAREGGGPPKKAATTVTPLPKEVSAILTHSYSAGLRFLWHMGPPLLRMSLRGLFGLNGHMLARLLLIQLWRSWRFLPRLLRRLRDGHPMPVTLQIVDEIRCGARCSHCLFSAYTVRGEGLSLEELSGLLDQAEAMDIGHVYLMGADPFHRANPDAYLSMLAQHRRQIFYLFTEGQRLEERHLAAIQRAGNIVPMLNIDGLEAATDARKGPGSWVRVSALLERLRAHRVPWFVTTMVSTANYEHVTSEPYLDHLEAMGAWIVAYLPYTPVDAHAEQGMVLSDAQRAELFQRSLRLNGWRRRLVVMDMLGMEQELTSCPAGTQTLTVYHDGTVAPCAAIPIGHRSSNVRERSLRELWLEDPLYQALRALHAGRREPLHCLYFSDTRFLADYLDAHEDELVIINPDAARWVREKARETSA